MYSITGLTETIKSEVLVEGHFRFTTGLHGIQYLEKGQLSNACLVAVAHLIAAFSDPGIKAVVAPEKGAVFLGQEVARQLRIILGDERIRFFSAEKRPNGWILSKEGRAFVRGAQVLAVEDITTTGGTLSSVVALLEDVGARVVGAAVLWNRGGVTKEDIRVPWLFCVVKERLPHFEAGPETCPGCRDNIPLDQNLGHAK